MLRSKPSKTIFSSVQTTLSSFNPTDLNITLCSVVGLNFEAIFFFFKSHVSLRGLGNDNQNLVINDIFDY
jgi:hypothetical protein